MSTTIPTTTLFKTGDKAGHWHLEMCADAEEGNVIDCQVFDVLTVDQARELHRALGEAIEATDPLGRVLEGQRLLSMAILGATERCDWPAVDALSALRRKMSAEVDRLIAIQDEEATR